MHVYPNTLHVYPSRLKFPVALGAVNLLKISTCAGSQSRGRVYKGGHPQGEGTMDCPGPEVPERQVHMQLRHQGEEIMHDHFPQIPAQSRLLQYVICEG